MKVLFGASVYNHLSTFHKPFMKWFQNNGYEVHAIGSNSMGRKDELLEMDVICHDVDFDRIPFSKKNIAALRNLDDLFKKECFDLIHVHTPTAAFLTRYAASKHKQGKVLYTAHGFHFYEGASRKNWALFYPAEKLAVKWTDGLVVMNDEDYKLGKRLGFKEEHNLFYVHGVGVDLNEFKANDFESEVDIRSELGLESTSLIVSCIAELSTRKNQLFLLENWKAIVQECPTAHLLFVGNGPDLDKLNTFIDEHEISNVYFLGFRKDVPKIIASSSAVTLLSKHEGLPRCLMEAMAVGKPIIASNVRGSRDLVDDNKTGYLIELNDNEELQKKFIKLLNSDDIRNDFGIKAKEKIEDYSIVKVLDEMAQIYKKYLPR